MKPIAALLGAVALLASCAAGAADAIVIKFSHVVARDTPKGLAAERFRDLVAERTRGRVRVEVYPDSQLYKDRDEIEALQLGSVQMLAPSLSKFGPLGLREFELFDLPYVFPNRETWRRVADGDVGRRLLAKLESKGLLGLAFWDNGFKQMSANRPLTRVSDFAGLRVRIQSSRVIDAQMRALGAQPQPMAFSDVHTALAQGVVEGAENPLSNFWTQRMHEVQRHVTLSDHGWLGYALIVNRRFWERLPTELRGIVEGALRDATRYERELAQSANDAALARLRESGRVRVHVLDDAQRRQWQRTLLPVHGQFRKVIGAELIQSVYDVAAQVAREGAAIPAAMHP